MQVWWKTGGKIKCIISSLTRPSPIWLASKIWRSVLTCKQRPLLGTSCFLPCIARITPRTPIRQRARLPVAMSRGRRPQRPRTTMMQQHAANFTTPSYPTPNIQIGPNCQAGALSPLHAATYQTLNFQSWTNYQAGVPSHFHVATYPTLSIQSGPNNQASGWAMSNKQIDKISTQLSFLVQLTPGPDQAETFSARAKHFAKILASASGAWRPPHQHKKLHKM